MLHNDNDKRERFCELWAECRPPMPQRRKSDSLGASSLSAALFFDIDANVDSQNLMVDEK